MRNVGPFNTGKSLQKDVPDLMEVLNDIDGLIGGLKASYPREGKIRWGPRMQRLLGCVTNLGGDDPADITIGEHTIEVTKEKRDTMYVHRVPSCTAIGLCPHLCPPLCSSRYCKVRDIGSLLVDALEERMPDHEVVRSFLIFEPRMLPSVVPANYGDAELEILKEHFCPPAGEDFVDPDALSDEWRTFVKGVLVKHRTKTLRGLFKHLSSSPEQYPLIQKLMMVAVLMAIVNAVAERGFSTMNDIMTKKKASPSAQKWSHSDN